MARELATVIRGLPDLSDQSLDTYRQKAATILQDSQLTAAILAGRYAARLAGQPGQVTAADMAAALERQGATIDEDTVIGPIIRGRQVLGETGDMAQAMDAATNRADRDSSTFLQLAAAAGLAAAAAAPAMQDRIVGYRKDVDESACDECQSDADTIWDNPDDVPMHPHDRCSITPVFAGDL